MDMDLPGFGGGDSKACNWVYMSYELRGMIGIGPRDKWPWDGNSKNWIMGSVRYIVG